MWLEEFQLWMASMIFTKQDRLASMISSSHEILWSVLCKKWGFSGKPPLFFIFILDQFHAKLTQKCLCFSKFFGIKKLNWLMVSWDEAGIKLWNPTYGDFRPKIGHFYALRLFLKKKKTSRFAWNHLRGKLVSNWKFWNHRETTLVSQKKTIF